MKETVNVNIGSQAFTLDEDAYRVLRNYLEDIRSRLPEYDTETMGDIESRIAEIFREIVSSPMRVITLDTVRETMNRMGSPADFGERRGSAPQEEQPEAEPRKLFRSRTDRSIAGICGGLAEYFHTDATVLRLITLFLILFGGLSIWAYIILWIVIPEEPARKFSIHNKNRYNHDNEQHQETVPYSRRHHRRRLRRTGRILRSRRIAHTHRNTDPHTLRRPFNLGLHHPLADRAEGSEAINRIAQWPKTT